ncbi:MAG: magnesium transporter CorA family protein [Clostridia bacterium]|nr:magnesium transporter CorA family protein [Clostridia bacterium]
MIEYYKTSEGRLQAISQFEQNCWINLVEPSPEEIAEIAGRFSIDPVHFNAALDVEESARIEKDDDTVLLVLDTPTVERGDSTVTYSTIPLGIISRKEAVITVSTFRNPICTDFIDGKVRACNTDHHTKFVLQLILRASARFLQYLKHIEKLSERIESHLRGSMKNKELLQLLDLKKSLVYFNTSLKSNEIAIKKIAGGRYLKLYEEDQELLEDVLIEINQAQEMAAIHLNILSGTLDASASIISNNLNIVMKVLATLTIVISVPTIIASFYGMNVPNIPLPNFWFPVGLSAVLMLVVGLIMFKKGA